MQPLRTKKKSRNFLRPKKNYGTSWAKKITQTFVTKKNHAILETKQEIPKPLGTKKILQPLGGKKSRNLLGEKTMQPLGTANQKK